MSKSTKNIVLLCIVFVFVAAFCVNTFAKTTVGVSLLTREHVYYNFLEQYLKEEAEKLDVDIIVMDGNFDSSVQMNQIQNFIVEGVDAILLAPASISGAEGSFKLAKEAGIPLLTFDVSAPGDYVAHVGTDNYAGGKLAGKYMAEEVLEDQSGKVVIVTYSEIEACVFREEGFVEVINQYPDIEVIAIQNFYGSIKKAANVN